MLGLLSRRGLGIGALLGIVLLALNALVFYNSTQAVLDHEHLVTHTQDVLGTLDNTLVTILDAETGQRGYIITADARYLAPYSRAILALAAKLDRLASLTADNSRQQARLATLRPLVRAKLSELAQTVALQRAGKAQQARAVVASNRGAALMDRIRAVLGAMNNEELALLAQRKDSASRATWLTTLTLVLATAADIALLVGLTLALQRAISRRMQHSAEQEQLLARERQTRIEAEEAVRLRDGFLGLASHELRTPLTAMVANSQLLRRRFERQGGLNERDGQLLQRLDAGAGRLRQLVDQIFDVTRLGQEQLAIAPLPMDLAALAEQVVHDMQATTDRHTLALHGAGTPLPMQGDALRLEQALQNLLVNAIKYSPGGGPIDVAVGQEAGRARLTVRDRGIGIPAAAMPQIFDRFYRAPNADPGAMSGLGVGLYVVREIVERHGGTIAVESTEGQGSCFALELPLQTTASSRVAAGARQGATEDRLR